MRKINLINKAGIQSEKSEPDIDIKQSIPSDILIDDEHSDEIKEKFAAVENELDYLDKTNAISGKRFLKAVFSFIIIVIIGISAYFFIYQKNNIFNILKIEHFTKKTSAKDSLSSIPSQPVIPQTTIADIIVDKSIAKFINKERVDLSLLAGIVELLPDNIKIFDFKLNQSYLTLICNVNDIISGENIKFFLYNHRAKIEPELFYIEKSENTGKFQITSLTKMLPINSEKTSYKYYSDRQLMKSLLNLKEGLGITVEPLNITSRDQTKIRKAFFCVTGKKSQLVKYIRELNAENINITVNGFSCEKVIDESDSNLKIKIELNIYPQK